MPGPVALVSMPTLGAQYPPLQVALLKSTLERANIPCEPLSLHLWFGARIGWRLSEALGQVRPGMVGEWIWARAAFGEFADDAAYLRTFERDLEQVCAEAGCDLEALLRVREEHTRTFIDWCLEHVDWGRFSLVGFSVVFQQTLASLTLARALAERHPELPIIFGGAAFEDDVAEELLRECPAVDMIHCGDGDETFPELVHRLWRGETPEGLPGVMWRRDGGIAFAGRAPPLLDLDRTPQPDFDEHVRTLEQTGYRRYPEARPLMLPVETSRGCWWGERSHCVFCGLNRAGMAFRAKSPGKVLEMLEALSRRYGVLDFYAIDTVRPREYLDGLFGPLERARADLRLHYATRPDLRHPQLRRLRRAGLRSIQPGVESLSTALLRRLRKGTTAMRNLELIKWCTYYGIDNLYNLLVGVPGGREEDYVEQRELVGRIVHLRPPWAVARARPDRGSPMFREPASFGIAHLAPEPCYPHLYPPDRFDLARVSYYFEPVWEELREEEEAAEALCAAVAEWTRRWSDSPRPYLRYAKRLDSLVVDDGRGAERRWTILDGDRADLLEFCEDARTPEEIWSRFDEARLSSALEELVSADLVVHLDGRYLCLVLPSNPHH